MSSLPKMSWESYTREQAEGINLTPPPLTPREPPEVTTSTETTCCCSTTTAETVIKDLEKKGEQFTKQILTSKTDSIETVQNLLLDHMASGSEEFKNKMGRTMTYAEMRAAWG